jgi:hypothetical protein
MSLNGQTVQNKQLYLTGSDYSLNRIDPVGSSSTTMLMSGLINTQPNDILISNTSSGQDFVSQFSMSHEIPFGFDRLLVVSINLGSTTFDGRDAPNIISASYGSTPMIQIASCKATTFVKSYTFILANPPVGTENINIALNYASSIQVGATSFIGVNQQTPISDVETKNNSSIAGSNSASINNLHSDIGDLFFNALCVDGEGSLNTLIPESNQTGIWSLTNTNQTLFSATSVKNGASNSSVSWTWDENQQYALTAFTINRANSNPTVKFTQNIGLC